MEWRIYADFALDYGLSNIAKRKASFMIGSIDLEKNLMKYKVINSLDEIIWQEIVDKSPVATFYHTPVWMKILCETFPKWVNVTFGIEFEDGNRAVFPMLRRPLFGSVPFYWYESTVPGSYGGPIFELAPSQEHYKAVNKELRKYKNILIVSNPFTSWQSLSNFRELKSFIQIIQLQTDFSKIWSGYSSGRQRAVRRATKEGVVVNEVDFLEYYQTFYEIYLDQLTKWGGRASGNYPIGLYRNLALFSKGNSSIRFFAAFLNNEIIGGLVVFYHNKHVTLGFVATLPSYLKLHPEDLLLSTIVEKSCREEFDDVDFGKSGGNDGIVKYKEYFGTVKLPLFHYQKRNFWGLLYRAKRHFLNYRGVCPE